MATAGKDKHYWTQLRSALSAGQWSTPTPARTPTGALLSWKELFRKFNKHCRGFDDVCEVASKTRLLGLLLTANSRDGDLDDPLPSGGELSLKDECILPEERVAEGRQAYDELKKLEASNFDTLNFVLAYYAYALNRPEECISHFSKVPDVSHITNHIPEIPASLRSNTLSLQTPDASVSSVSGTLPTGSTVSIDEIKDGRAWAMTETFRSLCLQGMSYEKLSDDSSSLVPLRAYGGALPLLSLFESEMVSIAAHTGQLNMNFSHFRELWRWIERLIWRAVALCATSGNLRCMDLSRVDCIWVWLKHYMACSVYWPPSFRTQHRSIILSLHLRALVVLYGSPPLPSFGRPKTPSSIQSRDNKSPQWLHVARTVAQEYRSVLDVCTQFPRAGERNIKVEDFVDSCVAVWEAGGAVGEHCGWVIDVLWWATRLTFNCPRIYRHMSRLFYVSGDASLAKRTLRLYIQVVGKAYQTLMSDSGKSVSSSRNAEETETALSVDVDTDRHWVETLTRGARMLCKLASVSKEAKYMDDLKEVGDIIAKARTRLPSEDHDLVAAVELAEGVWRSTLALKANDPYSRPANLALSHTHLLRSLDVFPTPAAAYHLALSFARPGPAQDLDQAIVYAGQAMETDPGELRYWHLMGLLLSGAEKWQAAMEILDSGADIGEAAEDEDATEQGIQDENSTPTVANPRNSLDAAMNGVSQRSRNGHISSESIGNGQSFHHPAYAPSCSGSNRTQDIEPLPLIPSGACTLPPSDTLLAPVTDYPRPSEQDQFEFALQLRMTRAAIAEYVEGAEIAEVKWLDVFSWIAEKRGIVPRQERRSLDGVPQPHTDILPPQHPDGGDRSPAHSLPPPIPINILPATPDTPHQPFSKSNRTSSDTETADTIGTNHQGGIYENSSDHRHTHIPRLQVHKRSHSSERDSSKKSTKRVQQFVKSGVHKGQATITTISKKIGNGVVRNGPMRRSTSTPDFHAALKPSSYQASSIHSRRRISSIIQSQDSNSFIESPPPPPPPPLPNLEALKKPSGRAKKENTLLSDLWLMSAATFRRLGKIEQAKGAIQEAEVRDEDNPNVWIQLGLYYSALNHHRHAIDALQKGLFLDTDNVSASVHLCRLYLTPREGGIHLDHIDLAAGILSELTQGSGWDVPEAWYYLAKAYGLQGRKDKERECLEKALKLSEHRPIRDFVSTLGCCI